MDERNIKSKIDQFVIDFVTRLRSEKKLNQSDIATIIEKSRTFVTNIENPTNRAKYNLIHINLLADHFGISPRDFLPSDAIKTGKTDKSAEGPIIKE